MSKPVVRSTLLGFLIVLLTVPAAVAAPPDPCTPVSQVTRDQALTAAFLYRFAQFVDWPGDFDRGSFVIGVFGDDALADRLDRVVEGREIDGRRFEVRRLDSPKGLMTCQIAFLGGGDPCVLPDVLARAAEGHVLTVSRSPGFARRGGIIDLVPSGCTLRLEINAAAAHCAGLRISAQLLKLATLVTADPQ
ncbi:MAG TPA: YfiR family protein [Vicinamibacterales bacterium]|jgi:hypothetical protein